MLKPALRNTSSGVSVCRMPRKKKRLPPTSRCDPENVTCVARRTAAGRPVALAQKQQRLLQNRLKRAIDFKDAYVDAVVLNVFAGAGRNKTWVDVEYDGLSIFSYPGEENLMLMQFEQSYRSNNLNVESPKELYWRKTDKHWQIVYEGTRSFPYPDTRIVEN